MEKNLMACPIDNKNLMEDPFEDEVFADFMPAYDHRENEVRHLVGFVEVPDEEEPKYINYSGYVDASWDFGYNTVTIKILASSSADDFEETRDGIFEYYKKIFKSWECEENPELVVRFSSCPQHNALYVSFYWSEE